MAANSAVSPDDQVYPSHNPLLYQILSHRTSLLVYFVYFRSTLPLLPLLLRFPSSLSFLPPFLTLFPPTNKQTNKQAIQTIHHHHYYYPPTTTITRKNTIKEIKKSKSETQIVLPPSLRIAQRLIRQFHRHKSLLPLTFSLIPHLRVLLTALVRMQPQREPLVGLPDLSLGGASIHAQHRVQIWTHRSPPRLPSAGRRAR